MSWIVAKIKWIMLVSGAFAVDSFMVLLFLIYLVGSRASRSVARP